MEAPPPPLGSSGGALQASGLARAAAAVAASVAGARGAAAAAAPPTPPQSSFGLDDIDDILLQPQARGAAAAKGRLTAAVVRFCTLLTRVASPALRAALLAASGRRRHSRHAAHAGGPVRGAACALLPRVHTCASHAAS
jgi:hypothetical protein